MRCRGIAQKEYGVIVRSGQNSKKRGNSAVERWRGQLGELFAGRAQENGTGETGQEVGLESEKVEVSNRDKEGKDWNEEEEQVGETE